MTDRYDSPADDEAIAASMEAGQVAFRRIITEAISRPGWTQARLARALAVRPQTVNKWVKGENVPPLERFPAIEDALGLERGCLVTALIEQPIIRQSPSRQPALLSGKLERLSERDRRIIEAMVDEMLGEE